MMGTVRQSAVESHYGSSFLCHEVLEDSEAIQMYLR